MNESSRILVVDDDDAVTLRATSHILKSAGYQVIEAVNGAECLRLAREQSPDLILLDVVLGDESGVPICQRIKADPQLANLFVVLLSSIKTDSDSQAQGLEAGADGYIVRPIANRELVARVQVLLRIKAAEDALRASEARYRELADSITDVFFAMGKDLRYTFWNKASERLTGISAEDAVGKSLYELFPDEAGASAAKVYLEVIQTQQPKSFVNQHRLGNRDYNFEISAYPSRQGVSVFTKDITERKRAEEGVRLSEARYRSLVETQVDIISRSDLSGNLTFVNDSYCRTFGVPRDQLLGTSFTPTVFPEDVPIMVEVLEAIKHPPYRKYAEIRNVTSQGVRWFIWDSSAVLDEQGHIFEFQGVGRDITERKRAEDAARALSARHQATLAAVPDIIMEVDNNKVYTWANEAGKRFFGADVIGKSADFYFEGEQETYAVVQPLFNGNEDVIYVESWQRRHDGEKRLLGWWCRTLKDAQGNVTGALSTAHDITDRKRAEEALQHTAAFLHSVIEHSPHAMWISDDKGTLTRLNQACRDLLHITDAEVVGKYNVLRDNLVQEQGLLPQIKRVYEEGETVKFTIRYDSSQVKHLDLVHPAFVILDTTISPVLDASGIVTNAIIQHLDITDRKRAEAALQQYSERLEQTVEERTRDLRDAQEQLIRQERLTVLGQLAGGIGHELRSPLGAIKNAAYLLRQTLPASDADTREVLDILDQQVEASNRTITSLLSFARAQPAVRRATDVRDILDAALAQSALPANIAVRKQYDEAVTTLSVDPDQMQIVCGNLIRNAVQAMPEGGQLMVGARVLDDQVLISFTDTGVGIAPDVIDNIFQPLFSTKARGMGLGLALCKLLIEGHKGTIQVTSQVGEGTTFTVCLPLT